MTNSPSLLWLRQDLRMADNPALIAAVKQGALCPVFILDEAAAGIWTYGGAARWGLHHALADLAENLATHGVKLILRKGDALEQLTALAAETGAKHVYWNRRYEPYGISQDTTIKAALQEQGLTVESFNARLLVEPWTVKNGAGLPFRVFTPFWKNVLARLHSESVPQPLAPPRTITALKKYPHSDALEDWKLLPTRPDWASGLRATWDMSEKAALNHLVDFVDGAIKHYKSARDFPNKQATSRLSPYLAFGKIGPRQCWHVVRTAMQSGKIIQDTDAEHFITELGWREFAYHLLYHFPETTTKPLNAKFENFPWRHDAKDLRAWQQGRTGYDMVDAGMQELWQTGWMHNRVRMVAASFLVKHLLLPWQQGAAWFWDTLLDADLASNTLGWQWVAGSGADAAPYFRIFNPILQAEKFDPEKAYINQYAPDRLTPIVAHDFARKRALEALAQTKES